MFCPNCDRILNARGCISCGYVMGGPWIPGLQRTKGDYPPDPNAEPPHTHAPLLEPGKPHELPRLVPIVAKDVTPPAPESEKKSPDVLIPHKTVQ